MAINPLFVSQELGSSPSTPPKANRFDLVPYVEINGARTLSDDFLVAVFERMKSEGLIPVIFHAIPMRNAGDFLALMKNPVNLPVFALSNTECIAFAWLNNITTNSAYGHFCHFKNDIDPVEIGKVITKHWFKFPIDIVLGSIPAFNMRAVKFMQKLGYVVVGEVPDLYKNPFTHEKCAAVIVYCRRPHG